MVLFLMVRIQNPIEVIRIVTAGRTECQSTSLANVHDHSTVVVTPYPPLSGNHPSVSEKSQIVSRASQKYGNAEVMMKIGGSIPSSAPPRRQADTRPMNVPAMKARMVVMPTSPSVHGSACSTWCATVSGKKVSEIPKWPRKML